jgi:hypothetical protein
VARAHAVVVRALKLNDPHASSQSHIYPRDKAIFLLPQYVWYMVIRPHTRSFAR